MSTDCADLTDYWVDESVAIKFSTTDYMITNEKTGGRWSDFLIELMVCNKISILATSHWLPATNEKTGRRWSFPTADCSDQSDFPCELLVQPFHKSSLLTLDQ